MESKKIVVFSLIMIMLTMLALSSINYAGWADLTDEEADKIAQNQIEEQEKEHEENINKSSINYLDSLEIVGYTLTPSFDKQILNYEIKEEVKGDSIEIKTTLADSKASVSGDGIVKLNSGENNIYIEVTAENGTVRTYQIKINKNGDKNTSVSDDYTTSEIDAFKKKDEKANTEFDKRNNLILWIALLFLICFVLIIVLLKNKKHHKKNTRH